MVVDRRKGSKLIKYASCFLVGFIKDVHEDFLTVVFENNWYVQEQMTKNHVDGGWLKFR
uniref:Agenet-like domain-containing protein n=1 Tax=Sciurus vulgaris TaxID=55149 RepID=A0A8D2CW33_SCIVU